MRVTPRATTKGPLKIYYFRQNKRGLTHSGFVINHYGNTINGHITASVCWEASSRKAVKEWRGFGGLSLTKIKSPDSGLQCIMGVSVTVHCKARH